MEQIVSAGVKKYQANKGTIVVMDPQTGNVLSMANFPTFDANPSNEIHQSIFISSLKNGACRRLREMRRIHL
jgi:cell division protein FtsI/penicillin-binding protein 2